MTPNADPMVITYRRTGGLFMLLTLAAGTLAATVLTIAVAASLLIVAASVSAVALLARSSLRGGGVLTRSQRSTRWADKTIDAELVTPISSSDTPNIPRPDDTVR